MNEKHNNNKPSHYFRGILQAIGKKPLDRPEELSMNQFSWYAEGYFDGNKLYHLAEEQGKVVEMHQTTQKILEIYGLTSSSFDV